MAQDYTTTALLASIKRRGMLPSTAETLSTSDFLALATEECQSYITDVLMEVREEYCVRNYDLTLTSGTATYALPPRAAGELLRDVLVSDGSDYYPIIRVEPEYKYTDYGSNPQGTPTGYLFEDDQITFVPAPNAATHVRLKYFRRPGKLVQTTECAIVSAIDSGRTVLTTLSTIPSTFTTGIYCDLVSHLPGFRSIAIDNLTAATTSATTITVTSALPASAAVGNYVALAGETPIPQIPVELHPLLAQRVVVKCLEALGDKKVTIAKAVLDEMRRETVDLLKPRAQGSARYLINRSGPGFRRGGIF